jgi:hypothetical protein
MGGYLSSGLGGSDWIDLTQDRGMWQAVMNAVMNINCWELSD